MASANQHPRRICTTQSTPHGMCGGGVELSNAREMGVVLGRYCQESETIGWQGKSMAIA